MTFYKNEPLSTAGIKRKVCVCGANMQIIRIGVSVFKISTKLKKASHEKTLI